MTSEVLELIFRAKDLASGAVNGLRGGMQTLTDTQRTYRTSLESLSGPANQFKNAMMQLGAVVGVAGLAKSFIEINSSAEKTKLMLAGLTGSTEKANEAFQWILDFSTKAPFSIDGLKNSFVKLQVAGLDPMAGSLQTLTDSIAAFGGSDQDLELAAVAIQQMAGKGVISMEELRQQLGERIPTAIQAMADGMGMSMQQLMKAIESGSITASVGLNAMMTELEKLYGGRGQSMMTSWTGLISNIKVAWEKFMLTLGETGVFDKLKGVLDGVLKKIDEMTQSGELAVWGERISTTVMALIELFIRLAGIFVTVVDALGPFLPALIQIIAYFKSFQLLLGAFIGLPLQLVAKLMALKDAFAFLQTTGIIPWFMSLRAAMLAAMEASTLMGLAMKATVIGAIVMAAIEIGKFLVILGQYLATQRMINQVNKDFADNQEFLRPKLEKHRAELEALGATAAQIEAAFAKGAGAVLKLEESLKKTDTQAVASKKTYEDFISGLERGSAAWIAVEDKRIATMEASNANEKALLDKALAEKTLSQADYNARIEAMDADAFERKKALIQAQIELEKSKDDADFQKIAELEEKKTQLVLKGSTDRLKFETDAIKETTQAAAEGIEEQTKLQEDYSVSAEESEKGLRDAKMKLFAEESKALMKHSADLLEDIRLKKNAELELNLRNYNMDLIAYEEYVARKKAIETQAATQIKKATEDIRKEQLIALGNYFTQFKAFLNGLKDTIKETFSTEDVWSSLGDSFRNTTFLLTQDYKSMMDEVEQYEKDRWENIGTLLQKVGMNIANVTFERLVLFGRDVSALSAQQVSQWVESVTEYVQRVKDLFASLQDTINSYQDQLDQMRGNNLAILDRWLEEEKQKLKDKYGEDLQSTEEYQKAMTLLQELYAEKRKKIAEDEARTKLDLAAGALPPGYTPPIVANPPTPTMPTTPSGGIQRAELDIMATFNWLTATDPEIERFMKDRGLPIFFKLLKTMGIELA